MPIFGTDDSTVPDRMTITHLNSGISISAQFNPDEVTHKIGVIWERLVLLGQSFQPLLYIATENPRIEFELGFDAMSARDLILGGDIDGEPRPELAMNFLSACCYTSRGAQDVLGGAPSRLHFFWPNLYSVTCKMLGVEFGTKRFAKTGDASLFSARVSLEVDSGTRVTFEDVLEHGMLWDNISQAGQ